MSPQLYSLSSWITLLSYEYSMIWVVTKTALAGRRASPRLTRVQSGRDADAMWKNF